MKKLFSFIIFVLFLLSPNVLKASNFAGEDITYTCLGGNTYLITTTLYRDCNAVSAPNVQLVSFECSSNSSFNFTAILNQIPGTGQEITRSCSSVSTECNSGNLYGIQEYVYQATVTLVPCNFWTISYSSCCRNPVSTVANYDGWYIMAYLNNLNAPCNSSPKFSNKPLSVICKNKHTCFSNNAIDPDGDSLVYSLYPVMTTGPTSSISYNYPWSYTNFLTATTPPGITIDSVTSNICFTPTTAQSTVFGIKVQEYRNISGVPTLIGTIYRDMQLIIVNCNNYNPIISGIDTSLSGNYSPDDTIYNITKCMGEDSIRFNIYGYDPDTFNANKQGNPEKFSISLTSPMPGALFKTYYNGTDSAYATFAWLPTTNDLNKVRYFSANIQDEACPYNASNTFTYRILVQGLAVDIGSDTLLCMGEDIKIKATTDTSIANYIWQMDGLPTGTPLSQDSFIFNSTNYSIGTHILSLEINDSSTSCPGVDKKAIKVAYQPHIHGTIRDTTICNNKVLTIDAGPGNQYIWKGASGNVLWRKRKFTTNIGGPYILIVDGDSNSRCRDTDSFRIFSLSAPMPFYLGKDTTIKPSQTLTLSMPKGMPSYIWSTGATTRSITIDNSFNWINKIVGSIFLPNNCYASDTIYVFIGNVGMEEKDDLPIKIFPNPMHQSLTIELDKAYKDSKLEIYDINGKQVFSKHFSGQKLKIKSLEQLSDGLYFVWLKNIELNVLLRVMKK